MKYMQIENAMRRATRLRECPQKYIIEIAFELIGGSPLDLNITRVIFFKLGTFKFLFVFLINKVFKIKIVFLSRARTLIFDLSK